MCQLKGYLLTSSTLPARAVRNLAHGDNAICRRICAAGGTDAVARLCESSTDTTVITQAAAALANLACDEACRAHLKKKFGWNKDYGSKRIENVSKMNLKMQQRRIRGSGHSTPASPLQSPGSSSAASRAIRRRTTAVGAGAARPASAGGNFARKGAAMKVERRGTEDDSESMYRGVSPLEHRGCNGCNRSSGVTPTRSTLLSFESESSRGLKSRGTRSRSLTPDTSAVFKRRGSSSGERSLS